jgi:hypothetical protein
MSKPLTGAAARTPTKAVMVASLVARWRPPKFIRLVHRTRAATFVPLRITFRKPNASETRSAALIVWEDCFLRTPVAARNQSNGHQLATVSPLNAVCPSTLRAVERTPNPNFKVIDVEQKLLLLCSVLCNHSPKSLSCLAAIKSSWANLRSGSDASVLLEIVSKRFKAASKSRKFSRSRRLSGY